MTDPQQVEDDPLKRHHTPREINSEELFQGERTVVVVHSGEPYRLSITRNDKLILQK